MSYSDKDAMDVDARPALHRTSSLEVQQAK